MGLSLGSARAATQYLGDGAVPNGATGGWDLPKQGSCPADPAQTTRPDCVALRLNILQASCTSPNYSWTTGGVCNDLVNTTQGACEATEDRMWNAGTGVCSIKMETEDRNNVSCALHGGTWVTTGTCTGAWVMPARNDPAYASPLLTGNSAGDQCLRCHNATTRYNSTRVRDVEDTLYMGHKNMARKVVPTEAWGGPPLECDLPAFLTEDACEENGGHWYPVTPYPSDDAGNLFNWAAGTINVGGIDRNLKWIYGDWLGPMPRVIYEAGSNVTTGKPLMSYSCSRCHTTGWTSDQAINTATDIEGKEPELSFPGITWDGSTLGTTGKVNLASGVSGDPNLYSSWDVWGISCTRCHQSAIDTTTGNASVPPQYSAPGGMSSHHNNLTGADANNGVCSDTRYTSAAACVSNGAQLLTACSVNPTPDVCTQASTTQAACETASGTWVAAAYCSNAFYSDSTNCTGNGFTWSDGWCSRPDLNQAACTGGTPARTWRLNGSQASCQVAGATWSFSKCSVEGACNVRDGSGNVITSKADCTTAGGQFAYATDIVRCLDVEEADPTTEAHWTGNSSNRGQLITALCMNCHRQETSGKPYADTGSGVGSDTTSHPGQYVKVGQYHNSIGFPSHPHGNMFLNSPHGEFSGLFSEIGTAKFGNGYSSYFQFDGEAAGTGNGCTGCHNPHRSTVAAVKGEEAVKPCQECHKGAYAIDLDKINHLKGTGTPFDTALFGDGEADPCITCHMPGGQHMFRLNASASYSTFPASTLTSSAATNANDDPPGSKAVWVDLDAACGQCHGGGSGKASTTLAEANSTDATLGKTLKVASTTGFAVGQRVQLAGGGSFEYDGETIARGDFESYITGVTAPDTITIIGAAALSVPVGSAVKQNPTQHGAPYYTKAQLALVAKGMHESAGQAYPVTFTITPSGDGLTVAVDASVDCGTAGCPAFTYDWDWGDSSTHGTLDPDSHVYATAGSKTITLKIAQMGKAAGSSTRSITLKKTDTAPVASASCTWDANLWKMTVLDASTDDNAVTKVGINFGDGSAVSYGPAGSSFVRNYQKIGTFTVTDTAFDAKPQTNVFTCVEQATPAYFSLSGTVKNKLGTANLAAATVQLYKGASIVKSTLTNASGAFSFGSLKPAADYTLKVVKAGYTFASPAYTAGQVGPSQAGIVINATNK